LPADVQRKMDHEGALKLLFVSHYNYYRNFETLLRALPLIKEGAKGEKIKLFLTCKLRSDQNLGSYKAEAASELVRKLDIKEDVVELGAISYNQLHHVYRSADIYVTPAYAETFAHPLVEAMSSGLPIVASDIPVHREICGESALFFGRFSPESLANQVLKIASCKDRARHLKLFGERRSKDFSWEVHLDKIVCIAQAALAQRN
jgi:glycosyltransferase involved in cell wall biosynthesis